MTQKIYIPTTYVQSKTIDGPGWGSGWRTTKAKLNTNKTWDIAPFHSAGPEVFLWQYLTSQATLVFLQFALEKIVNVKITPE